MLWLKIMANAKRKLPGVVFESIGEVGAQDGIVVNLGKTDAGAEACTEVEGRRCATGCPGSASVEEKCAGEYGDGMAVEGWAGFEVEDGAACAVEASRKITS